MFRLALRKPGRSALQKTLQKQSGRQYSNRIDFPPHVREAGLGKIIVLLTPLAAVGGAITYAKYDKEFRKKLAQNVPGAEYVIQVALQEENPFQGVSQKFESVKKQFESVSKSIESATATVTALLGNSDKNAAKKTEEDKTTSSGQKSAPLALAHKPAEDKPAAKVKAPTPKPKPLEPLPSDVVELEHAVEHAAALAVNEYNKAIEILKNFNSDVLRIVDVAIEKVDTSLWTTLRNKTNARDSSVATAEQLAREAMDKIEKCEVALAKAAKSDNHDQIIAVRSKIKKLVDHIHNVKDELYKNKDIASISEKYWRNVEKARHYFVDEIQSIFPGLNLAEQKLKLSQEDLDLFITHAYSHVLVLQKELERLQTDGELRLKRALRGDSDSEASKAQLEYLVEAEKRKLAVENQKKIFQIRADAEKQLRQQLKQQAEAHVDHIKDAVSSKENEMRRSFSKELEDKLASEKANYKLQLAAMLGKMRGMDSALQARAESERSAHQAQALWAACQALWATVRTGEPGEHWKTKLRPLKNEIKAITKVAEGDELVAVVIQNLPREAQERGVFPEDALRERFLNVERIARKLALIPEDGASLPKYFLSYSQSVFILQPNEPISQDELQNKKFDYSKLDTYDILNRARYFVDRGDLVMALRYANLLQGAPRKIASDWIRETRLLLETQQAANILMAHAAASGLLYL